MKKYFYIYNFEQAKFFIDSGLKLLEIGKGTYGDIYHKFERNEVSENVFTLWNEKPRNNDDDLKEI